MEAGKSRPRKDTLEDMYDITEDIYALIKDLQRQRVDGADMGGPHLGLGLDDDSKLQSLIVSLDNKRSDLMSGILSILQKLKEDSDASR